MKTIINNVFSLGVSCHTAFYLKNKGYRMSSTPFDWVWLDNHFNLQHILQSDFSCFLDDSYLTDHQSSSDKRAGHKMYGSRFFNHFNPRIQAHAEYYKRCIARFRDISKIPRKESILFMIMNHSFYMSNTDAICIKEKLQQLFPARRINICIINVYPRQSRSIWRTIKLDATTVVINEKIKSYSLGWKFHFDEDDKRFDDIIHSLYKFNCKSQQQDKSEQEWS